MLDVVGVTDGPQNFHTSRGGFPESLRKPRGGGDWHAEEERGKEPDVMRRNTGGMKTLNMLLP